MYEYIKAFLVELAELMDAYHAHLHISVGESQYGGPKVVISVETPRGAAAREFLSDCFIVDSTDIRRIFNDQPHQ